MSRSWRIRPMLARTVPRVRRPSGRAYSSRTVFRRLPRLFCFAEFAQKRGCTDVVSAPSLVDEFASEWLVQHGAEAKTSASLRKHAIDVGNATRQMLRLASGGPVRHNRHRRPFPLESEVPGFEEYLRSECGLMESTIHGYRHHLHEFAQYLRRAGITSLGDLSPALLASFIVECAPGMAPCTRRDLCCHLKVLLRFCHREGITDRDLRGAVGMPRYTVWPMFPGRSLGTRSVARWRRWTEGQSEVGETMPSCFFL